MKVDQIFGESQVRRLAGFEFFPKTDEAIQDLVSAAMSAETEDACRKAFDELTRESVKCPKPVDIYRACYAQNSQLDKVARPKCSTCNGTLFIHGEYLVTKHSTSEAAWTTKQRITTPEQMKAIRANLQKNQEIMDGSEMCHCHPARLTGTPQPKQIG